MKDNLLYENKFAFQVNSSTKQAILQLTCDIAQIFDNDKFTLGFLIESIIEFY